MSDSSWAYGLQHARLPCPLPSPRVCSKSCPLSQWCHPTISPSVTLFSSCPQSFPASGSFPKRWSKYWISSFSISSSNEYSGFISFRIDCFYLLSVQETLKSLLQHHSWKASILQCLAMSMVHLLHPCMTTGKTIALTMRTFVGKVMSQLFNTLSRIVIVFLPRNKQFHACSHCPQWFWSPRK